MLGVVPSSALSRAGQCRSIIHPLKWTRMIEERFYIIFSKGTAKERKKDGKKARTVGILTYSHADHHEGCFSVHAITVGQKQTKLWIDFGFL